MDWAALGASVDEPRPAFPNLTRTNRPLSAPASRGPQSTVAAIVRGFSFPDIDFNSERAPTGAAAGCARQPSSQDFLLNSNAQWRVRGVSREGCSVHLSISFNCQLDRIQVSGGVVLRLSGKIGWRRQKMNRAP